MRSTSDLKWLLNMSSDLRTTGFKFVVAGAINTGLTYVIYLLLLMVIDYKLAYVLSFVSGIAIAMALNAKFVFQTRLTFNKAAGFVAAYCLQLVFGTLILQLVVEQTTVSRTLAPLCVMVVTVPLSFFMNRYVLRRL